MSPWIRIIGSALAGAGCVIAGAHFVFDPKQYTEKQYIIAGLVGILAGVMIFSIAKVFGWMLGLIFIISGFYFFGRAAGRIEYSWLATIFGFILWIAAAVFVIILARNLKR